MKRLQHLLGPDGGIADARLAGTAADPDGFPSPGVTVQKAVISDLLF